VGAAADAVLLTFVLAFEGRGGRGLYERRWWLFPTLLLVVAMSWGLSASRGVLDIGVAVPLYCAGCSSRACSATANWRTPSRRHAT